jgi:alanine racemase
LSSLIRAEVSAAALRANLARIREVAPARKVMAVIKANAYGHGLVPTALCLAGADAFAVARIEEAMALRSAGVRAPIVLLEGVFTPEQLAEAARHDLELVVHDSLQIELLETARHSHRFLVWLKIDTGMNRLGFRVTEFESAHARMVSLGDRLREIRLMTHFARADERDCVMSAEQLQRFSALLSGRKFTTSLANSAAIFALPRSHGEWVRPGLALYGVAPFAGKQGTDLGLTPAMRLLSTVISLRNVPKGETVGYGGGWTAQRDSRIAIVAAGYGDGLPWALRSGSPLLVAGHRVSIVGRVSMDMVAVDVTDVSGVSIGVPAILWGPELPVEEVARSAGTIPWELLCAVSQRVPVVRV